MKWRIVTDAFDGLAVLDGWYDHPWEAELEMQKHYLTGWIQGFKNGAGRTYARDWLRVEMGHPV